MVGGGFVPDRGDLIWLDFTPQAGREQAGRRPALVLSPTAYNGKSGLAIVCPVTSHIKGYPFEVLLPNGLAVSSVVLADHLKSVDWDQRKAELITKAPPAILAEVLEKAASLLGV
jgi:mRNA interferase MazF